MREKFWIALCVITFAVRAHAADPTWYEIKGPHFRVLTDGSAKDGRDVAREFEQIRAVLAVVLPTLRDSTVPLLIAAVRNEGSARRLVPAYWKQVPVKPAGIFRDGFERRIALVRLDFVRRGRDTQLASFAYQAIYHGYTRSLIHANFRWLPMWLDVGLGEYFANTRFQKDKVYVGAPSPRGDHLQKTVLFPMEEFLSINPGSKVLRDPERLDVFYGQSWALVHMLMMAPKEDGKGLQSFVSLVDSGTPPREAFQKAVGDVDEIAKKLDTYISRHSFQSFVLSNPVEIRDDRFSSRRLSAAEADAELGNFQLWGREVGAARVRLEQALKADSQSSLAHEAMGFIDFKEGKDREAFQEFERAVQLNGDSYLAQYYRAMLSPQAKSDETADQESLRSSLLHVLELNPRFAPAYVELAALDIRQNDLRGALIHAQQAEGSAPSKAGYHTLVANLLRLTGRDEQAEALSRFVAERWPGLDHDEAVSVWQKLPQAIRKGEPLSPTTLPQNISRATGRITSVTCNAKEESVRVVLDGVPLTLHIAENRIVGGFSDTLWYGSDHFSFCRHTEGLQATIYYQAPTSPEGIGLLSRFDVYREFPAPQAVQ